MEILPSQRRVEQNSLNSGSSAIPPRAIARFWTRMAEIYGHKWVSQFGECADDRGNLTSAAQTWSQGLATIPLESISLGFSALVEKGNEWPPSLPEFLALCQPEKPLAPYHQIATALPPPEVDEQIARESLAKIRKILSRSKDATRENCGASGERKRQAAA